MAIKRQSVTVLRFWYRISTGQEARTLSHPAFRWLYGLCMSWSGHNNGAIEFTRRRHGAQYGLGRQGVFERARRDVLATGLVMRTRPGGRNLPDLYALALVPLQVAANDQILGPSASPTARKILGPAESPIEAQTGPSPSPNWTLSESKEFANFPRKTRPSLNKKEKCAKLNLTATEIAGNRSANPDEDACQGEGSTDAEGAAAAPRAAHGFVH